MTLGTYLETRKLYKTKLFAPEKQPTLLESLLGQNEEDEEAILEHKKMIILDNAELPFDSLNHLEGDYQIPHFIADTLKLEKVGITLWDTFHRHPKFNHKERVVCMIAGSERFRLVSAIFK